LGSPTGDTRAKRSEAGGDAKTAGEAVRTLVKGAKEAIEASKEQP
jgi:hypothetical protein